MTRYSDPPGYDAWVATVPDCFKGDPLWRVPAYRYGMMLSHVAQEDAGRLRELRWNPDAIDQLLRAVDSISANLAEGYSKTTGPERARIYEIALASAREARDWYYTTYRVLGSALIVERCELLTRVIKILTAVIPRERVHAETRARSVKPKL